MTENEKQRVAIFRFSVIHEFVGGADAKPYREKAAFKGEVCPEVGYSLFGQDPHQPQRHSSMDKDLQRERRSVWNRCIRRIDPIMEKAGQ